MSEPTQEELIEIATNFILSSPPGELGEVVTDVRALLPDEKMINASASRTFREYNTEQMIAVDSPKGHKVLITKYGEVSDSEFVDPRGGLVLRFDHIKQQVVGNRPISGELEASTEPLRSAFDKAFAEYVKEHYPQGAVTTYGKGGDIIVAISAARFNSNNFWNGRWRAVWTYHNGELTGHFKIVVHYYEDGNVQLNTDTTVKVSSPSAGSPDATAAAAVKAALKAEQTFQSSLEANYSTMGDTTFKALRRKLPITQTKIDWDKIKNYKVANTLGK
ncbi:subunit of heterodimeric actin capping protein cap32/34 [Planoprotostelium fungivorum]|uniref:F-actin-capping protein subunit alpha n=1 Tax=Planoprotostelium fungivorum TaxID=1890364 RepID=A0A2P6MQG9_9EUKA|nr:subunit of heterodimeric actin capping protein cap32/34 [Planoprotostelium fungivorum]